MSKRRKRGKRTIGRTIVRSLKQFAAKLKSGEPIKTTTVRREMTPHGPLHTFTKRVI